MCITERKRIERGVELRFGNLERLSVGFTRMRPSGVLPQPSSPCMEPDPYPKDTTDGLTKKNISYFR